MLFNAYVAATAILWISLEVKAQTTNAVCATNHTYLYNQGGQSPCLITAYLENACAPVGGNWNVGALGPNQNYVGPYVEGANYCSCSSVVYSMISACAACQNDLWIPWSTWSTNCTTNITTIGQWPLDIPVGTEIPAWAYQNVTLHDTFVLANAQATTGIGPESTYYGTPTASINPHSSSSTAAAATAPITANINPNPTQVSTTSGGSKTPVGPIVGGVIGGIAVLFLAGVLIYLILRNKKRGAANSEMPLVDQQSHAGMTEDSSLPAGYGVSYPSPTSGLTSPQKLYDPADPSTFPGTPASFAVMSDRSAISHSAPTSTSYPTSQPTISSSGRYTGAAEV
ncbi:hypothetical protein FRB94_007084 [Tulasnella sp. JGI-2019a]|nr:hypothetical protein FRB94_007084 [Tulasnella sp. JGI-2019a]